MANQMGDKLFELVAVAKYGEGQNDVGVSSASIELMNGLDLAEKSPTFQGNGSTTIIQRFVKCKGPKPFIARTVWRLNKPAYSWAVTSNTHYKEEGVENENKKYVTTTQDDLFNSSIIKVNTGKNVEETVGYIQNIVKFLEPNMAVNRSREAKKDLMNI